MKKSLFLIFVLFLLSSCLTKKRVLEKIDYKTDYKFSAEIEASLATDTVPWKYQMAAYDYSLKGDVKKALFQFDFNQDTLEKSYASHQIDSINAKYTKLSAHDYVIEESKKNQIIIINEAHQYAFHRVFTKSLLKELYENGYTHFGLEALANTGFSDSILRNVKYPHKQMGYYTKEPQCGDLVRTALQIGFTVFAYETTTHSNGKQREIDQAKNIQAVMDKNPNGKFLIHCGFAHLTEGNYKSWEKAMAGRITEYTGINPLTISQTRYIERSNPKFNPPFFKALDIDKSTILLDENNTPLGHKNDQYWVDILVFHPNTRYVDERPSYIFENENQNVLIPLSDIQMDFPVMVLAYANEEDINSSVPMDIQEIESKNDPCNLGLKKGAYTIVLTNGKESIKFDQLVK